MVTKNKDIDTSNAEFQNALRLVQYTNHSFFLTGKAGTGKSTFLKYICAHTKKKHVILAPTGIAAINVGGVTLHSFFKLPFYPFLPDDARFSFGKIRDTLKYNRELCSLIKEIELIVIDEISMVRADIIDVIDKILRVYSHNIRKPFGGKQMLFVGDMFQLEPVLKSEERALLSQYYPSPFFFSANVFQTVSLVSIELTKVYRQKDISFVALLDRIRCNQITNEDMALLNRTCRSSSLAEVEGDSERFSITLATKRHVVDHINSSHLERLSGNEYELKGKIEGDFPETALPTSEILHLKVGAQVIFVKNDLEKQWVNGTVGRVEYIDPDLNFIEIITEDGKDCLVKQEKWTNIRYHYNPEKKEIEEEILGAFEQFPIKLAWAMTVHKSQGLTFSKVLLDFSGGVFAAGQVYVALSRCTSLQGFTLLQPLSRKDIFVRSEILAFSRRFNDPAALSHALQLAHADIEYHETVQAFNRGDFESCINHFFEAIHARYEIENPLNKRFIRSKLEEINRLRRQNQQLREELHARQEQMNVYAREYYQMGNECVVHAHNNQAAIRNYDKAIALNPNYLDAWVRKGDTLVSEGEVAQAERCFSRAIELSPLCFKAWYHRGKLRLLTGRPDEAVADFDKATSLKPDHAQTREFYGNALMQCGQEIEAAEQWAWAERLKKNKGKK